MRHYLLLLFLLITSVEVKAQNNLVPNPSFEDTISLWQPTYWTTARESPDYWNDYMGGPAKTHFFTPFYAFAPHPPRNGHGMMGLLAGQACWQSPFVGEDMFKEVIESPLTSPLQKDVKYYISFYCKPMDSLQWTTIGPDFQPASLMSFSNHLGVYFTNTQYDGINSAPPAFNKSPVCAKNVVSDTGNWVRISGVYIPDSNYNYIMVGNFFDGPHTTFYHPCKTIGLIGNDQSAYYFIDDVFVSTDSTGFIIDGIKSSKDEYGYSFANINNQLIFDFKSDATVNFGSVYDLYGNIKKTYTFQSQLYDNLNDLTQGIYLVKINHSQTIITKKIVIEHEN